jgi:hypothetical protein
VLSKPKGYTFDAGVFRVNVRVVNPERPTGLARVGYRQNGWDITVRVKGPAREQTHDRVGTIMWRDNGRAAWSLASKPGLWEHANTLDKKHGRPWSYASDEAALRGMIAYIRESLEKGPFKLRSPLT